MIGLLLALALADEPETPVVAGLPECAAALSAPPEALSVSWISPLGRRAGNARRIPVFATRDLRGWLAEERSVGDLLRYTGVRKRQREPRRVWKVTVFEVHSGALCRPIEAEGVVVGGLPACDGGPTPGACGHAVDRSSGAPGPEVYVARWRDLASRGFCVLTADRFVAEGAP